MTTKTKIIIGIGAALILLVVIVGAGLAGGFYYVLHRLDDPAVKAKLDKAKADGTGFGKTTDQNGCMTKAYTLIPVTDSIDISNAEFTNACMKSSTPTPGFCEGVPFVFNRDWFAEQCKAVGHNDDACLTAFIAKRNFCQMDGKN